MATTTTTPASGTLLREVATVRLDGGPLGMALDEDRDLGYLTMGQGRIVRFSISSVLDGVWDPVVVADGLESPRGIALAGDLLVIAELGPLPCPDPFPLCVGEPVGSNRALGESNLLSGSSGRLVAYTVGGDGALTGRRVLVDGLPVINSHHGVNGVALGSDGKVYASIGSYQQMVFRREVAEAATHPNIDWLGTVLRVDPATGEIDVFASGLRNVFAIAFDDTGALWGVDNDGRTFGSWRAEEVVRIQEGDEFGHPYEGSYGPWSVRTAFAVWHAPTAGSAGVAWGSPIGLDDTLLIGSCGRFDALQMEVIEGEWRVHVETGWTPIVALEGCATAVATVGTDTVLVASVVGTEGVLSGFESNG